MEAEASPATIEEGSAKGKGKKREVSPAVLLQQLQLLRGDLSGLKLSEKDEGDVLEGEGQRETEDGGVLAEKTRSSKGLLERLGQGSTKDVEEAGLGPSSTAPKPPTMPVKEGELEKRLADLERMLGANEADVDEVSFSCCNPAQKSSALTTHLGRAPPRPTDAPSPLPRPSYARSP